MLQTLIQFIFNFVVSFLGAVLLLRAWLYVWALSPRHPLMMFCSKLTDWLIEPIGKVVKPSGAFEWRSIVGALIVALLSVLVLREVTGMPNTIVALVIAPFAMLLRWTLEMISWGTFIWVVLSWINPRHPMTSVLALLVDPFIRPIRRFLPMIGNFDFSPIVVILLANLLLYFVTPLSAGYIML